MIQNLESTLVEYFKRERIAISERIGERPQDLAYQIAWNIFHFKKENISIYPQQIELMQLLDYLSASKELTKLGDALFDGLNQFNYYENEDI